MWLLWKIRLWRALAIPATIFLGLALAIAFDVGPPGLGYLAVMAFGVLACAGVLLIYALIAAWAPAALTKINLKVSSNGLVLEHNGKSHSIHWRDVLPIIERDGVIVIATRRGAVKPLLHRAFQSEGQRQEFLTNASEWQDNSRTAS